MWAMVDPFTVSHMGQLGFFPLSSYSRPEVYFRSIKCVSFYVFAQNLFAGSLVLIEDLCALKIQTVIQEQLQHTGTKNLKIFGTLLQWLPSSTLASGIIPEGISAGLCADLPNESKPKYMHWGKHKTHAVNSPSRGWILRKCSTK